MRILYVENHSVFASNVVAEFLSSHQVTVVPTLEAARQAIQTGSFDLLLVDYDLDDGKGDTLLKELRDSGRHKIAIGVSSHDEGNAALLRAGAVAICNKLRFDKIQSVIDLAVRGRGEPEAGSLLWWILPGALAGMPMPFIHPERRLNMGGSLNAYDDELPALYSAGIRAVVSLLNLPSDGRVYKEAGFVFSCFPVPDGAAPTLEQAEEFVSFVDSQLASQRPVAVHCEAGLGRTGTMLATYLIARGDTAEQALRKVRAVESSAIETAAQIAFLEQFSAARRGGPR